MVKVHDEDMMAEPRQVTSATASSGASAANSRHSQYRNGKSSHNTNNLNSSSSISSNHLHHSPHQYFHHYHHHWSFPASNLASSSVVGGSPTSAGTNVAAATFHFGPGFEPQQQISRYTSGSNAGTAAGSSGSNPGCPSQQHVVHFHVNPGVTVSFQMGDNVQVIKGPVTVPMVSTNSSPPIAMPVQVPPGHVVQQIVDESGTLRHVILSPQPPIVPMPPAHYGPGPGTTTNQPPQPFFAPQGLPPGYPPPHFGHGSAMQPGVMGHVPPSAQQGK